MVQAKIAMNPRRARRNNTRQPYLLRTLLSCGAGGFSACGRSTPAGAAYDTCDGHTGLVQRPPEREGRCPARSFVGRYEGKTTKKDGTARSFVASEV